MGKTKYLLFLIFFLCIICSINTASATVSYNEVNGITFTASDNIHNLPQLYTALSNAYGQSTTDSSILKQNSTGYWWSSTFITVPNGATFWINSSTCTEIKFEGIYGYPIIDHTRMIAWVNAGQATFNDYTRVKVNTPIHDAVINYFTLVQFLSLNNCSVYNISMNSTNYCLALTSPYNSTFNNISISNCSELQGSGIEGTNVTKCTISNITTFNTGDYIQQSTNSYGILIAGGTNNTIRDCDLNGSSWSTFCLSNNEDLVTNNNTVSNITINNSGHNGFEQEGNDTTVTNVSASNSAAHNFFQVGKNNIGKKSINNTYSNIYSYNPGTSSFKISEGSDNITVKNVTIHGNGFEVDSSSNSTVINCTQDGIAPIRDTGQCGYRLTTIGGFFNYNRDHTIIDSNFSNNILAGINEVICRNLHIINVFGTKNIDTNYENDYTTYYYPNIVVKNIQGNPISNAVITVNTSAVNGLGKSQASFYTDSNGKLYDMCNRTNWLAIPDQKLETTESGVVTTSYITTITVTKNGKTNSTTVNPDSTWYSANPASLSGPIINLTLDLTVPIQPDANFSTNVSEGYAPLTVQFTDLSTNTTSWNWNFGDGNTSIQQNPTHTYYTVGTYTVNLTGSNANGTDTKLATINATQNPTLPKANFSSNVSEGYVPLTVQFTDLSVNVTSWNWNFGDGNTSTQQNPTHTYYTAGTYTVNLTGNNSNGIDSKLATINAIVVPILPDANFSTNVSEGYAPLTVQFTDLSTNTTSWNWDFGDGNTSIQQNPTHTYYTVGTYTVNLTGSNSNGTDSKLSTIVITPTPVDPTNLSQDENYSIVGPYIGSLLYNAPTSGTPNQYGLNGGKQTRIRQNGYVRGAQFAISNVSNLERFNICIWRRNYDSGMFTLVGKTENLKPNITIDGIQNILFSTPLYAKEGDYIGWECDGIDSVTPMITTSSVPTESADVVICHGINRIFNVSNQFNFLSSSMYQTSGKIFRINLYMDAVDTAFIGDSEVSGRPVHTSYVDPGTYYNPWSSMSFWWGVYSGRTYQNLGWRGQTTTEIRNRFYADAIALHPSNIFIEGGLNDFTVDIPKETTLSDLCWMTNETVANGAHAYLCEIPPSTGYGEMPNWEDWQWVNDQLKTIYANNQSVTIIPIRNYVGTNYIPGPPGNLWSIKTEYDGGDALHYNIAGYQKFGSVIYNYYSNQFSTNTTNGSPPLPVNFTILNPAITNASIPKLTGWNRSAVIETATNNASLEYVYIPRYPDMKPDSSDVRFFASNGTILPYNYLSNLSGTYYVYNYTHSANDSVYCAWGNNNTPDLENIGSYDIYINEDGESTVNWTVTGSTLESSATKAHTGTNSLKYTDLTTSSFDDTCTLMLPSATPNLVIDFWANPSQNDTYSRCLPSDGAISGRKAPWVVFGNDGLIEHWEGGPTGGWDEKTISYIPDKWYHVKIVCRGSKYDMYLNNTLWDSNVDTYNPVTAYDRIVIFGSTVSGASCYYDDINVSYSSVPLPTNQSTFRLPETSIPNIYSWDFDNDGISDSSSLATIYTYSANGIYTVNLTSTNDAGSYSLLRNNYITVLDPLSLLTKKTYEWINSFLNRFLNPRLHLIGASLW